MATRFKIHPSIGIARLGNSPDEIAITPETFMGLPIAVGPDNLPVRVDGHEQTTRDFWDSKNRIKRWAARFRVYVYDGGVGHELQVGEKISVVNPANGQTVVGTVNRIEWTAYLANKKSSWYQFKETLGEHGYAKDHPRRNADIVGDASRQMLIIDPGPRSVAAPTPNGSLPATAEFDEADGPVTPKTFPPSALRPRTIDTLGGLIATREEVPRSADAPPEPEAEPNRYHDRLLVLGGFGNSGSMKQGFGHPQIDNYANNDGWFDDVADGPITAKVVVDVETIDGQPPVEAVAQESDGHPTVVVPVHDPAWVLTAYPAYVPQLGDIITLDEAIYDISVRKMGYDLELFGKPPFDDPEPFPTTPSGIARWQKEAIFNPKYYPYFYRDIWPILERPQYLVYVLIFDPLFGAQPHGTGALNNFYEPPLSVPPYEGQNPEERRKNRAMRERIYAVLRQKADQNKYQFRPLPDNPEYFPRGMPEMCGDNPISNTVPQKFLTLTEKQLFLLKQWARGHFINEKRECITPPSNLTNHSPESGDALDHGVLSNCLGGAFCPGAEVTWIIRNPAIYSEPYRIRHSPEVTPGALSQESNYALGMEPGDISKYDAVPWQADMNECSTQNVDITYENWNSIDLKSVGDPVPNSVQNTFWWPLHRPLEVQTPSGAQVRWGRGIPADTSGDLTMVTEWATRGFIVEATEQEQKKGYPEYFELLPPKEHDSGNAESGATSAAKTDSLSDEHTE